MTIDSAPDDGFWFDIDIDHDDISANAVSVIRHLQNHNFDALLVGGAIRDLLLGGKPKDFDVATDATPEQVRQLFKNSRIVGRRFKIVHVLFGREVIEVTTFRDSHDKKEGDQKNRKQASQTSRQSSKGLLLRDNVYGDLESDAFRRDFSVNALYYDPLCKQVLDFMGGLDDLEKQRLSIIGNADARYAEDPVRLLRAVRFEQKLGFTLDKNSLDCLDSHAYLLKEIPPARLFDEVVKLLAHGRALATLQALSKYKLLRYLVPAAAYAMEDETSFSHSFIKQVCINTDERIAAGKRITPAFLFAAFLWPALLHQKKKLIDFENRHPYDAQMIAARQAIETQNTYTAIPRRFQGAIEEIWSLQYRLQKMEEKKSHAVMAHPRFRAAYDFVLMREQAGENLNGCGAFWTEQQKDFVPPERSPREYGGHDNRNDYSPRRNRRPRRR